MAWIWHCCGCGVGQQLEVSWETPYASSAALKRQTNKQTNENTGGDFREQFFLFYYQYFEVLNQINIHYTFSKNVFSVKKALISQIQNTKLHPFKITTVLKLCLYID